jgi:hypothetical protein
VSSIPSKKQSGSAAPPTNQATKHVPQSEIDCGLNETVDSEADSASQSWFLVELAFASFCVCITVWRLRPATSARSMLVNEHGTAG